MAILQYFVGFIFPNYRKQQHIVESTFANCRQNYYHDFPVIFKVFLTIQLKIIILGREAGEKQTYRRQPISNSATMA